MPLVASSHQGGQAQQEHANTAAHPQKQTHPEYDQLVEPAQDDTDEDMLARPRPKKLVPDVPQKSRLRASRILENLTIDLQDLGRRKLEDRSSIHSNPHDSYLSSEEDGSASGDDCEDVASEGGQNGGKSATSTRRHSYKGTARAVSLRCVKPRLVEISHHHRSVPDSVLDSVNKRRPDSASSSHSNSSPLLRVVAHPKRHSSLGRPPASLETFAPPAFTTGTSSSPLEQTQPSFLENDPFPESASNMHPMPMLSRSDTASSQLTKPDKVSGWGSLRAMSRTLALARKKASMPKINLAYTSGVVPKPNTASSPSNTVSPTSLTASSSTTALSYDMLALNPPTPSFPRRSHTFERLLSSTTRDIRAQSGDWSNHSSPTLPIQPNTDYSPIDSTRKTSPVEQIRVSPPIPRPATSAAMRPTLQRERSYTTSIASSSSETKYRSRSHTSVTSREDPVPTISIEPLPTLTTTTTTITTAPIPTPSTTTPASPIFKSPSVEKEMKFSRRMTALPYYPRSGRAARQREQERRGSHPHTMTNSPEDSISSPSNELLAGNTYNDIMKSVAVEVAEREGSERRASIQPRGLRPKGSMALLSAGLRRGKGVKA